MELSSYILIIFIRANIFNLACPLVFLIYVFKRFNASKDNVGGEYNHLRLDTSLLTVHDNVHHIY